ncbi:ComEA family DNA-binding protein [Aliivibrio fischeri]|uniref:ComEA family DNA-binding protein n=1 Tax=Aliivibrio fischeri TaxID=668 RepID=UPI0007C58203|nr:ComEA family DNA-binding protein [Aliivibrio fischeri]MUJ20806.1 transporter [Aliivibrio fischeri]
MKRILTLLSTLMLTLTLFSASVAAEVTKSDTHEGIEITVNINQAGAEELKTLLVGVGESKAQAIIDYRNANGKFVKADDLTKVKGIGDKLVEKNRDRIIL